MNKTKFYFKKIFHRTDFSGLSVFGRGQSFDWEILLTFLILVMIVVISFSVHVFLGVRAGDLFQDGYKPPVHDATISRDVLTKVISDFATRADTLKNLQAQKPIFVDPSL